MSVGIVVSVLGVALGSRWQWHHLLLFRFTSLLRQERVCKQQPLSSFPHFCFSTACRKMGWGGCLLTLSFGLFSCIRNLRFIRNLRAHGTHCCFHSLASSRRVGSTWPLFRLPAWWSYHVSRNGDVSVLGVALCSRWQRHHPRLFRFTSSAPAGTGLKQRPPSSFFRFCLFGRVAERKGGGDC